MADRKKDTAIANPETNSGPRYPYGVVLWQGRNWRIAADETPPNAQDTSGKGGYNNEPGGGVFQISGRTGLMEMSESGRGIWRVSGQMHQTAGKGRTATINGSDDTRAEGGSREQTKEDKTSTVGGGQYKGTGGQSISGNDGSTFNYSQKNQDGASKGSSTTMADGDSNSSTRGDRVHMHKGQNIQVTDGEWGNYVVSGNGSSVFQKSYKMHVDERYKADVHKTYDVKATDVMTIESEAAIRFKVGDSSITIYPDHIHIKSSEIKIGADEELHLKGKKVKLGGGDSVDAVSGINQATPPWVSGGGPPSDPDGTEGANVGR